MLAIFISCVDTTSEVYHPIKDQYPYYDKDLDPIAIERKYDESVEEEVIVIGTPFYEMSVFKNKFHIEFVDSVALPEGEINFGLFASPSDTSVIFSDTFINNLFEYRKGDEGWNLIAAQGRGPGEMLFTSDITVKDQYLITVHKDSRINYGSRQLKEI